jgi:outer membrane protein X
MKRVILAICLAVLSVSAYAQEGGKFAAVVSAVYGTEIAKMGVGVKAQYYFNEHIRGELGFNIFAKNEPWSTWDVNLNFHYLANIAKNRLFVYPLAGFSLAQWKMTSIPTGEITEEGTSYSSDENKSFKMGPNLGVGVQVNITPKTAITAEARYQMVGQFDQGLFGIGIQQRF